MKYEKVLKMKMKKNKRNIKKYKYYYIKLTKNLNAY